MSDKPIINHLYTADPSAHVFDGKLYVYPSHDRNSGIPENNDGDHYDMADYHVFSMDEVGGPVKDHGIAFAIQDVPWASKQLWAPDAAKRDGRYYFYFPARDKEGLFRIGVATSDHPAGPFKPEPEPIPGSYSIDPCSFVDEDGRAYLYFGGIWGGQLQSWSNGTYDPSAGLEPSSGPAVAPRMAELSGDMKSFAHDLTQIQILDEDGTPIQADDHDRRFFEAPWLHKRNGVYYFSYATGDTHYLVYATANNPYGPFTYAGRLLEPVIGWTSHHSIVEYNGKWYLFHHDASLSGGRSHLRCVKVKELVYDDQGKMHLA